MVKPLDLPETRLTHQRDQPVTRYGVILSTHDVRDTVGPGSVFDEGHRKIVNGHPDLPDLKNGVPGLALGPNAQWLEVDAVALFFVVISDREYTATARARAFKKPAEGREQIVIREQVRHRVVAGNDKVELPAVVRVSLTHISLRESDA